MTTTEQEQFLKEYKAILQKRDEIKIHGQHLQNLHRWDRNGSHQSAIIKALDKRKTLQTELAAMLKGKTYEQWKAVRVKLSSLKGRLTATTNRKEKIEQDIHNLSL